jgi:DNA primase
LFWLWGQRKGDIFSFVEQFEGLDFRGALKILAERAGVPLVYDQKADGEREQLFRIMEEAAAYFEEQLQKSPDAQNYVTSRAITPETRKSFRIGWIPDGWRNLYTHLKSKKYSDALIEKAGLAKKKEGGVEFYDRFRGRVMFPISDSSGRVIAFTGRILVDDGKSAKYLNSPDTPLYDKSQVLYGLDKAKSEIRQRGFSILVEGQMDLVLSHQAGVKNTVAASGTALTDESLGEGGIVSNLGLVRRLSSNIIVAFDSDTAGRKAALRAAGIALSMGMDVKIADLPEGKDPADMIKEHPEGWKDALRGAKPVIEFELGNVLKDTLDPRKVPRALRERVFPFFARIDSAMDQAHFVKMIADRAHIADDAVWQDLRAVEKTVKTAVSTGGPAGVAQATKPGSSSGPQLSPAEKISAHIDMVERRMMGLLLLMEKSANSEAATYRETIKHISGAKYDALQKKIEPLTNEIQFEAEAIFGSLADKWATHMKELVINFEENSISEELIRTMQELRMAEKAGDGPRMGELAKKCQELSMKKAEVKKKRG